MYFCQLFGKFHILLKIPYGPYITNLCVISDAVYQFINHQLASWVNIHPVCAAVHSFHFKKSHSSGLQAEWFYRFNLSSAPEFDLKRRDWHMRLNRRQSEQWPVAVQSQNSRKPFHLFALLFSPRMFKSTAIVLGEIRTFSRRKPLGNYFNCKWQDHWMRATVLLPELPHSAWMVLFHHSSANTIVKV